MSAPALHRTAASSPGDATRTHLTRVPRRSPDEEDRHRRHRRLLEIGLAIGIPAALLLVWQLAATRHWIDPKLYPSPTDVAREGWDILRAGRLRHDIIVTTRRVLLGFALGSGVGFIAGVGMGLSRLARRALEPMLNALYVVPKLALLPIFLTLFGFGETPKVVLVGVTVFFFVWIQTMEAIVAVPEGFREAARSLGMTRTQNFRHVLLPAAMPQLFVALRIAMGVAVLVNVGAEFIVGNDGVGNLIFTSRQLFINAWVYVGIVTIAIEGVILTSIVDAIGRRATPWNAGSRPTGRVARYAI